MEPHDADETAESWRSAVDDALRKYVKAHYADGALTVSALSILLTCVGIRFRYKRNFEKH